MTDADWLLSDDPDGMLTALGDGFSNRKLLLFACGCLRLAGAKLAASMRGIADGFEKAADGLGGADGRKAALWNLAAAVGGDPAGVAAVAFGLVPFGARMLGRQVIAATRAVEFGHVVGPEEMVAGTVPTRHAGQAGLLRELQGPTLVRPAFDPAWRTGTAEGLARAAYEGKAFDRLPILADALEDAGCTDPHVLGHCRDTSPIHARGCWVVDLVLGLE